MLIPLKIGGSTDLSFVTAGTNQILTGYVGVNADGEQIDGSMPNKQAWTGTVTPNGSTAIPAGYHNGNGYISCRAQSLTYKPESRSALLDMGADNSYRYVNTNSVPNTNSDTYTPTSRGSSDMGSTNTYRYVNTNSVPNKNTETYSLSNKVNETIDLTETHKYRYIKVRSWDYDATQLGSSTATRSMKCAWNSAGTSCSYISWTSPTGFRTRYIQFTGTNCFSHGYVDFANDKILHNVNDVHIYFSDIYSSGWSNTSISSNRYLPPGYTVYIPTNTGSASGNTLNIIYCGYYV